MRIKKILIANRGEIAIRVLRTCRELGIDTVSVHSTEDEESLHVKLADESVCIGPAKSSLSYLNIPSILSAAEITGSDAIHPGFGFLSENKEFAALCGKWNIIFIGPSWQTIEKMGDKILSKRIAAEAGIPVLTPVYIEGQSEKQILQEANNLGYPVIIKASAGGGGRGMKRIDKEEELLPSLKRLREEARNAFGDGTLFLEKYIRHPRHIEVQILADKFGNVIHLGERDCTIQRRFQKILEESPSPILTEEQRQDICMAAVKLSKFVNYDSVGTVEFIFDQDHNKFYFMEMNTRIQVEHPVTEQRTGIDLIAEQIRVASHAALRYRQEDILFRGHAIECRINAEDPKLNLPCPGRITYYYRPGGIGIRVDDFIYSGYKVSPHYDSMLAKVIAHAPNRSECIARMSRALKEMIITGISSNIELHQQIMTDSNFIGNSYDTNFLAQKFL